MCLSSVTVLVTDLIPPLCAVAEISRQLIADEGDPALAEWLFYLWFMQQIRRQRWRRLSILPMIALEA